jgi:hypothetical protein
MNGSAQPRRARAASVLLAAAAASATPTIAFATVVPSPANLPRSMPLRFLPPPTNAVPTQTQPARDALFTWATPSSGAFSLGGNWVGGAAPAGNLHDLLFGGVGGDSYAATSDLPQTYGNVTLDRTGVGVTTLGGSLTARRLRVSQGSLTFAPGGSYAFTSTGGATAGAAVGNLDAAVTVGNVAGQTARYTQSAASVNGGTNFHVGNLAGATGIATFSNGATLTVSDVLGASHGSGTINVHSGSAVTAFQLQVARNPGGSGSVDVAGVHSALNLTWYWGGFDGVGTTDVSVRDAAVLTTAFTTTPAGGGLLRIASPGQAVVNNGLSSGTHILNLSSGGVFRNRGDSFIGSAYSNAGLPVASTTVVNVDGAGSLYEVVRTTGSFLDPTTLAPINAWGGSAFLGYGATDAPQTVVLTVSAGGSFRADAIYSALGRDDAVNVTVVAGTIEATTSFALGYSGSMQKPGNNSYVVANGGSIRAGDLFVGHSGGVGVGGESTLGVSGAGSTLRVTDDAGSRTSGGLFVGYGDNGPGAAGSVSVASEAVADIDGPVVLGARTSATGTLNVSGAGTTLTAGGPLLLGGGIGDGNGNVLPGGTGTLLISDGGVVTAPLAVFGGGSSGSATVSVSGAGSRLHLPRTAGDSGHLFVADASSATAQLAVGDGGAVEVGGHLVLAASAGAAADVSVDADARLLVRGGGVVPPGVAVGTASLNVHTAGTLAGKGTLVVPATTMVRLFGGATLSPGNDAADPTGTLTVAGGGVRFDANAIFAVDIASAGAFDALAVPGGTVSLAGELRPTLLGGFVPAAADVFPVLGGSVVIGSFDADPFGFVRTTDGDAGFEVVAAGFNTIVLKHFTRVGDIDRSGGVNNQDIAPFVSLLTSGGGTGAVGFAADVDGNGVVNNQDIAPFVALLTGGRPLADLAGDPQFAPLVALVPEPSGLATVGLLAAGVLGRRRRPLSSPHAGLLSSIC